MVNKLFSVVVFVLAANTLYAQTIKITEPEFSGTIIFVDAPKGNGLPLETTTLTLKAKANASMYIVGAGKVVTRAVVKGATSTTKISQKDSLQFIYRAENNTINPKDVIQLYRFESKGKERGTVIATSGTFTGASLNDVGLIPLTAKKYATSSYLITVNGLSKGEYGFSLGKEATYTIHMFTVE